jgi:hypothetical protein
MLGIAVFSLLGFTVVLQSFYLLLVVVIAKERVTENRIKHAKETAKQITFSFHIPYSSFLI